MNCRETRMALALGAPDREAEFAEHLVRCSRCLGLAAADRRIDETRIDLLTQRPAIPDVRGRVLAAIAHLEPDRPDEPRASELGFAAATAGLAAAALLLVAASDALPWHDAVHGLRGLVGGAENLVSVLALTALGAMRVTLRLLSTLQESVSEIAARMEVAFAAAVGLGYAAMAGTILCVLGRDVRARVLPSVEE